MQKYQLANSGIAINDEKINLHVINRTVLSSVHLSDLQRSHKRLAYLDRPVPVGRACSFLDRH